MTNQVFFRVDGSESIGLGHVFRAVAIADMLSPTFAVRFILGPLSDRAAELAIGAYSAQRMERVGSNGIEPLVLAQVVREQTSVGQKSVVVFDGYHFDPEYQRAFAEQGIPFVSIDDKNQGPHYADIVFNHAGGLNPGDFIRGRGGVKFCLGPKFLMIRKAFLMASAQPTVYDAVVSFGGADPLNFTQKVVQILEPQIERVAVVLGDAYRFEVQLRQSILDLGRFEIIRGASGAQLAQVMAQARSAVTSASTVAYEYLAAGRGHLHIIQTMDNQRAIYQFLIETGAATDFADELISDSVNRTLIDRSSPQRIVSEFEQLVGAIPTIGLT